MQERRSEASGMKRISQRCSCLWNTLPHHVGRLSTFRISPPQVNERHPAPEGALLSAQLRDRKVECTGCFSGVGRVNIFLEKVAVEFICNLWPVLVVNRPTTPPINTALAIPNRTRLLTTSLQQHHGIQRTTALPRDASPHRGRSHRPLPSGTR